MIEVTHEEWKAEIERIADNEPGWSLELIGWHQGWEEDDPD